MGVLDDAFADGEGKVEAGEAGVALFEGGYDSESVEIVIEAKAVGVQGFVEGFFAGMTKGRVANVVNEREGFCKRGVEAEGCGSGAGDLGYFESVSEAAAGVVALGFTTGEYLSLSGETAEGFGVQDAADVAGKCGAIGMVRFEMRAMDERIVCVA